ncbi:hypothetical protein [Pseudonocardia sp. SID8383]|uniref:hypothetical protein n=1 Tax=Pseudonocardia sp. SID8383 TaxID=2690363 RepID=UPI0013701547|nr:hypothetical protein [Pseudonocardia sp. SID8383]MYW74199.1 hypothetical protein [Pseudonocardia sp. SID8383]
MNTRPAPAPAVSTVVPAVRLVEAGLRRADDAIWTTPVPAYGAGPLVHAARARRLAELHTRRARWWTVLRRIAVADHAVPTVYLSAVVTAAGEAEQQARFWSDAADDWQARADRRPTSEVAGAMSNWADLGLTEPAAPGLPDSSTAVAR